MNDRTRTADPRFRLESEREAKDLVDQATAYGRERADAFAGAWMDYIEEYPYAFAAFVGPQETHRAALDPRVRLVGATRTLTELEATLTEVRAFGERFSVDEYILSVDAEHERLVLYLAVEDEERFEHELRARFGGVVDLYLSKQGRVAVPLEEWHVGADGRTIEAMWTGGHDERDHRLDAVERDGAIHLTASSITEIDLRRAAAGDGPRISWGRTLPGYDRTASVQLSEPVGDRPILDDQRDRIDDHPPVGRSWWRRRNEDMLGLTVMEWVDRLDWAEGRGCEGPGENGWIRIHATVDDTERLRAAIEKKFGPGFEVAYQAPYVPEDDE